MSVTPDSRELPHYASPEPFDPYSVEAMTPAQERFYLASQWRMMWWKLKRHRIAVISGAFLLAAYASILIWITVAMGGRWIAFA